MDRIRSRLKARRAGQSLVEFTILLPVLLIMLSGLIEFGFMLNSYLDVIDAAREAARYAANDDPTLGLPNDPYVPPTQVNFWHRAFLNSRASLASASDGRIYWNPNDPFDCAGVKGDIVVSGFGVLGNTVDKRFPLPPGPWAGDVGARNCGNYQSKLTTADVNTLLSGSAIPNNGFVVIEIYYEYEMLLGLPWITAFVPDPIVLYAYTIMPNTYAEPTPTP